MNAFFIGLIFLIAVAFFLTVGILFLPLFLFLGLTLHRLLILAFVIFAIWLLGKIIIFVWENFINK
jgi:hypothetical protein